MDPEPDSDPEPAAAVGATPDRSSVAGTVEDQTEAWLAWCATVGELVLPIMLDLHRRIPQTSAAMLCTADGFNLCALGLDESAVGRMAALTSSLYAVALSLIHI